MVIRINREDMQLTLLNLKKKFIFAIGAAAFASTIVFSPSPSLASAQTNVTSLNERQVIDMETEDGWFYQGVAHHVFHTVKNENGRSLNNVHTNLKGTVTSPDGIVYKWIGENREQGNWFYIDDFSKGLSSYVTTTKLIGPGNVENSLEHVVVRYAIEDGEWVLKVEKGVFK
jgi:hypothetical protein